MGWAGNYNNKFYFGITANIKAINYTAINKYGENFGSGGGLNLLDTVSTKGNGINMNLGAIYRPNNFLRFGLSVHVPTIYKLEDNYYSKLNFDAFEKGYIKAPDGSSKYQLQEPWQINVSGALIVGKKGLLSAEYAFTNFTDTRLMGEFGDSQEFNDENAGMKDMLNDVRTLKIGGEYKLNDNFSVRGGFANSSSATKTNAAKLMRYNTVRTDTEYFLQNSINYLSAGFGYREANWFVDFAYMHKILDESFYPYNSNALTLKADPAKVLTTTDNLVITLGLKF
jgi:long-subunit fatty acid transport protein